MTWLFLLARVASPVIFCLFLAPLILAADITLVPEIDVKTEWNDNVDMSSSNRKGDAVATFTPSLSLDARTERLGLNSAFGLGMLRYAREEERNTEYFRFSANAGYRVHERLQFSANGSVIEDEALQTELEETGIIVRGVNRRRYGGGGGFLYDVTPWSTLGVDGSHQRTKYGGGGYVDSEQDSLSLTYRHTLSDEVNGILVQPYTSRYGAEQSKTDSYGLSMGWTRAWSETLSSQAMLGARHTKSEYTVLQQTVIFDSTLPPLFPYRPVVNEVKTKESNWGGMADISLTGKGESHSMSMGYKRDLDFSADGDPITRDRFYWSIGYAFTERLGAGLSTALIHSESEGNRSLTDTWYFDVTPSVSWKITEDHVLRAGYSYSSSLDKTTADDRNAERHRIWVGLTMRYPRKW
ncbi:MAG: outer membrane beta-barrel protein [Thermodesulfobacteriota bacterium]